MVITETEIWRTAVYDGVVYEGLYQVSNFGRILSLNYNKTNTKIITKFIITY